MNEGTGGVGAQAADNADSALTNAFYANQRDRGRYGLGTTSAQFRNSRLAAGLARVGAENAARQSKKDLQLQILAGSA